ncbi:TPA: SocA family protein [Yersinia enterocolitica]|nr:SocA family protein [Yersinia enterocolitica]
MYSPIQVANKFIELAAANGTPITQMQAQKLTYIAHGISLGHRDAALLSDPVCAWRYGPVLPSLYHLLKNYGASKISSPVPTQGLSISEPMLDDYANSLIKTVFDTYGKYSAEVLSEFTHRAGTPWQQTMSAGNTIISDHVINDYYKRLMARDPSCIGL